MPKLHKTAVLLSWCPMLAAVAWAGRAAYFTIGVHAPEAQQMGALLVSALFVIVALGVGVGGTSVAWALSVPTRLSLPACLRVRTL